MSNELIEKIENLNRTVNEGRGSQVLRSAVLSLRRGDLEGARVLCTLDHDKLYQYPGVLDFLIENGLIREDVARLLGE